MSQSHLTNLVFTVQLDLIELIKNTDLHQHLSKTPEFV